jgi:integrase
MAEQYGWKIISDAGKALKLPLNIGSHTMRKSFANIAACVDKSSIDMNSISKIQGLLNHSDQRVTMRYLGTYQDMFNRARVAVSDFVMGKTGVQELVAGNNYSIDDIMSKLEELELSTKGE